MTIGSLEEHRAFLLAREGNIEEVGAILGSGVDVNTADENGLSLLHVSTIAGKAALCRFLLAKGANVNRKGQHCWTTPLHLAAKHGCSDILLLFLEKGAEVNAQDGCGRTTLYYAAQTGSDVICQLLLKNGADVNKADQSGHTPLHQSVLHGHSGVCQLLLEEGANVNAVTSDKFTPLHYASRRKQAEVAKLLLDKGANISALTASLTHRSWSALHLAVENCHFETCQVLLEYKADVNKLLPDGMSCLHLAAARDNKEICRLLLKSGADADRTNQEGETPLYLSALRGGFTVSRLLLASGADVQRASTGGYTPLSAVATSNNIKLCRLLLESGADVNATDKLGRTPLHCAVTSEGREELCRLLLEWGAELEQRTSRGETPLHTAAYSGQSYAVKLLIEYGADIEARDEKGRTPLYNAARCSEKEVAQLLIKAGADVKSVELTINGDTPFEIATRSNFYDCSATWLIQNALEEQHLQERTIKAIRARNPNATAYIDKLIAINERQSEKIRKNAAEKSFLLRELHAQHRRNHDPRTVIANFRLLLSRVSPLRETIADAVGNTTRQAPCQPLEQQILSTNLFQKGTTDESRFDLPTVSDALLRLLLSLSMQNKQGIRKGLEASAFLRRADSSIERSLKTADLCTDVEDVGSILRVATNKEYEGTFVSDVARECLKQSYFDKAEFLSSEDKNERLRCILEISSRLKGDILSHSGEELAWAAVGDVSSLWTEVQAATKELELVKDSVEEDVLSFAISNDPFLSLPLDCSHSCACWREHSVKLKGVQDRLRLIQTVRSKVQAVLAEEKISLDKLRDLKKEIESRDLQDSTLYNDVVSAFSSVFKEEGGFVAPSPTSVSTPSCGENACLLCDRSASCVTFIPCGHLCCCLECVSKSLNSESRTALHENRVLPLQVSSLSAEVEAVRCAQCSQSSTLLVLSVVADRSAKTSKRKMKTEEVESQNDQPTRRKTPRKGK